MMLWWFCECAASTASESMLKLFSIVARMLVQFGYAGWPEHA